MTTTQKCIECGTPSNYKLNPSGLFCTQHELERRARITESMKVITKSFEEQA